MIFRELKHAGVSQGAAIGRRQPNCCFNGERDCFINAAVPGLAVDTLLVTLFGMSEAKPDLKQSLPIALSATRTDFGRRYWVRG